MTEGARHASRGCGGRHDSPFAHDPALDPTKINACQEVSVTEDFVTDNDYRYTGLHSHGAFTYQVTPGTPVTKAP